MDDTTPSAQEGPLPGATGATGAGPDDPEAHHDVTIVERYLPLDELARARLDLLPELYTGHNAAVNVVSRQDIDRLMVRHVLHSLAIAKVARFGAGDRVLDVGTGGGFPGIPLAILFPDTEFILVDSIGKKIRVVEEVARTLRLENVSARQARAESLSDRYDHVVTRAVAPLAELLGWTRPLISPQASAPMLLALKGGDLRDEIRASRAKGVQLHPIAELFPGIDYFRQDKYVLTAPYRI